jgi:hypothetical protein
VKTPRDQTADHSEGYRSDPNFSSLIVLHIPARRERRTHKGGRRGQEAKAAAAETQAPQCRAPGPSKRPSHPSLLCWFLITATLRGGSPRAAAVDPSPSDSVGGSAYWLERRSGSAEAKGNGKPDKEKKGGGGTPPTPKDSRPRKPAVPKASAAGHGTTRAADKSPGSGSDRKVPKAASRLATPPEVWQPATTTALRACGRGNPRVFRGIQTCFGGFRSKGGSPRSRCRSSRQRSLLRSCKRSLPWSEKSS